MNKNYHLGLLHLVHLLVSADGIIKESEKAALLKIKINENIPDKVYDEFQQSLHIKKEPEIYHTGMAYISQCTDAEKIRAFVTIYKLSEVDGNVHTKEIRLLLYSIKIAGIEFDDIVEQAKKSPSLF